MGNIFEHFDTGKRIMKRTLLVHELGSKISKYDITKLKNLWTANEIIIQTKLQVLKMERILPNKYSIEIYYTKCIKNEKSKAVYQENIQANKKCDTVLNRGLSKEENQMTEKH